MANFPTYFFFGEEVFLAHEFVQSLKGDLFPQEEGEGFIEKYNLETHSWRDIIDSARTPPLLFSSQLIIAEKLQKENTSVYASQENLTSHDKKLIEEYLASPTAGTVLVIIYEGKIKRSSSLVQFFSSLPPASVCVKELKPLRNSAVISWAEKKLRSWGKNASYEALTRLTQMAGHDLRRIHNELEKIVTFVGEREQIERSDIDDVSGWVKSFVEWEVYNSLEKADYKHCLITAHRLLENEGLPPVRMVNLIAGFFRDVYLTKLRLMEGEKSRKEIFKEIKPQIQEKYRSLYQEQFSQLFSLVKSMSIKDLKTVIDDLRIVDLKLKSTTLSFQILLEGFFFKYCWLRKYGHLP